MSAVLEVEQLSKRYGSVNAVRGLNIQVQPGEVVALLGPNGSGKTTSLRCIAGLLNPSAGRIRVCGHDLQRAYRQARQSFAYLPQQAQFPPNLSVKETAVFHAQLRGLRATDALTELEQVELSSVLDRAVNKLSGGMRQRLALAIASLGHPPLMLLDEPTANLDPQGALQFRAQARSWRLAGRALLLSTHVLADVEELADRVIVLVEGHVVAEESCSQLKARMNQQSRLRVYVDRPDAQHAAAAMAGGALDARLNCSAVLVTAAQEQRVEILTRMAAVSDVRLFETEQPNLEDVYLQYMRDAVLPEQGNA